MGLFPYVDTELLEGKDLIAYEYHRPLDLDDDTIFHHAQAHVYQRLLDGENVILSAPTSFGKSLIIDALIASGRYRDIVIVVPTLALIDETRRRLYRFSDKYKIVTHVSQALAEQNIFVMTQERVLDHADLPNVDLFVIDEFYKLSPQFDEDGRSALLNQAFYRLQKTGAQFYLLGPDIRDLPAQLPERLECVFIRTDAATVVSEQRIIPSTRKTEQSLLVSLCRDLDQPTLIFCSSPKRARDVANWLIDAEIDGGPGEVANAVDWMSTEYHPRWLVPRALARGIGLHHGRMPRALAQYMVRAFNELRIRFLLCTSTLIEGVNTKAKNVIIFDHTIARRKYDFFTFNNIRGRSGRMFEHMIGNVFLFHEPPARELPLIDFPAFSQPDSAPKSLLVQLDPDDLADRSRVRLAAVRDQRVLAMDVIRANIGIDPDAQVALASEIRAEPDRHWTQLRWSGHPTAPQLGFACRLIWDHLGGEKQRAGGVLSAPQLAFKISRLRELQQISALIASELQNQRERGGEDADEAVETVLDFLRKWAGFNFPRLLMALHRIQESVFADLKRQPGDYRFFAASVEGLFMPSPLVLLDEYGIPWQTARRLASTLAPDGDLDSMLKRLRTLTVERLQHLHPFEIELVLDAQQFA
jgi:hypothetical protein